VGRSHDTRAATIAQHRNQIMEVHLKGHKVDGTPGIEIQPAEKNWWGGLNSITAWVDHVSEIEGDRYANTMFGTGDRLKTDAYQRILAGGEGGLARCAGLQVSSGFLQPSLGPKLMALVWAEELRTSPAWPCGRPQGAGSGSRQKLSGEFSHYRYLAGFAVVAGRHQTGLGHSDFSMPV
jgi:hypothetical protein